MDEAFPSGGSIDPASFPFLVFNLHRQSATGSLKVEGPAYHKALYFRSGRLLFASSNDPGDQLGSILVETQRITQEQLDDVNSKVGPGSPLAKLLSESGVVSQRELAEAARAKVERIFSDVISYETGSFEFEDGVLPKGAVDLKLSSKRVALAAVRRIEDREFVLRHLGGLDVVLTQTSGDVTDESAILAAQFDGQRSLKEAASLASLEEFDAAKIACAMVFLGWAQTGDAGAPGISLDDGAEPQLDFGGESDSELGLAGPGDPDETMMLGTAGVPQIDTAATMAEGTPASAEPAWPEAVAEPDVEPEEPEPTQAWPSALGDDEESPGSESESESAWPEAIAEDEEAPTLVSSATSESSGAGRAKPTSEDLAALDALLSTKSSHEGPLAPIGKDPSPDWQPQFLSQGGTSRGGRAGSSGRGKVGIVIAAVAGLALAGGGAYWYFVMRPATDSAITSPVASRTTTQPPAPMTLPAVPATTTDPSTEGTPPPPASAGTELAATTPAPPAATTPAPSPTAATPTPAPQPATAGSLEDARRALRSGKLDSAARAFASHARGAGTHTLQVLVACVADTVTKAMKSAARVRES